MRIPYGTNRRLAINVENTDSSAPDSATGGHQRQRMIWRVWFEVRGGHVHCALFAAKSVDQTFAKCGDFAVRLEELDSLVEAFNGAEFLRKDE